MSTPFWHDLLSQEQQDELKQKHKAALEKNANEFMALHQMWDTRYVSYLYEYLNKRSDSHVVSQKP